MEQFISNSMITIQDLLSFSSGFSVVVNPIEAMAFPVIRPIK
jgi:hypothetical protein